MTQIDKKIVSFLEIDPASHFSIHNLPYGVFSINADAPRIGIAIGDYILDLAGLENLGILHFSDLGKLFNTDSLNQLASLDKAQLIKIRQTIQTLLSRDNKRLQTDKNTLKKVLIPRREATMHLPFKISAFTDFYASENHASNVGKLFRGNENPLLPNWKYLPVAYNGRASTIFLSGKEIRRPAGQIKPPTEAKPFFSNSRKLDFELEMGMFIGKGNLNGQPIAVNQASAHIFGLTLLNDWSARDIQAFEYQPLGPFLSKSFATSISPWVVTLEALAPFKTPHQKQVPETVDYLSQDPLQQFDIKLEVALKTKNSKNSVTICETNFKELYWTMEQMLAHHTVNNCIMNTGDLLGSGTISGSNRENWGSLLEISFNGTQPIKIANDERSFLEDGDTVIMSAYCQGEDFKVGFGTLEGKIISNDH